VTKDAEKLGVRNWRARARDRDDWRRLLESAKTAHGVVAPGSEASEVEFKYFSTNIIKRRPKIYWVGLN